MPYCTIEEAWAKSLTTEELKPYDENEIFSKVNTYSPYTIEKNMSRTYKRLSGHNGPETRLTELPEDESESDDINFGQVIETTDEEFSETYKNEDDQLKKLINENKSLKKLIKSLKKNTDPQNNRDFILYIFSGLVTIMILENFRKIYKQF